MSKVISVVSLVLNPQNIAVDLDQVAQGKYDEGNVGGKCGNNIRTSAQ